VIIVAAGHALWRLARFCWTTAGSLIALFSEAPSDYNVSCIMHAFVVSDGNDVRGGQETAVRQRLPTATRSGLRVDWRIQI